MLNEVWILIYCSFLLAPGVSYIDGVSQEKVTGCGNYVYIVHDSSGSVINSMIENGIENAVMYKIHLDKSILKYDIEINPTPQIILKEFIQ